MMPEITGFDVLSSIRAENDTVNIPVIVLTAKLLTEEDHLLLERSATQILAKQQFDPDIFMRDVVRNLDQQKKTEKVRVEK